MPKTTILLADDHKIVLDGLRSLLIDEFQLVGTATDGLQLVEKAAELNPDLIVADISMPLLNGIDALRQIRERNPEVRMVFLTMHPDSSYLTRAFEAGALGYVLKHAASDELVNALHAALRGERFISPELKRDAVVEFLDDSKRHLKATLELTPRQRQVLQLLAEGNSAKQIGAILEISARTVETHKYKMMDDLGVKTTAQLVQHAIKLGLVSVNA
jgi:DNA-binding NarL/FixJ family response regulator